MEEISISRQDLIPPQKGDGIEHGGYLDKIDNQALHQNNMEKQWTESADFCNRL
jgi:hypothetical protein